MLDEIRKASSHFLFKFISFIIILSFVSWGISDILRSKSDGDVVKFNNVKSISQSEFFRAKQERIKYIKSIIGSQITDEQIENLNIDKIVLDGLINDRMFGYAANYYDLHLSDQNIISKMKQNPSFADKNGKFSYSIFENHIKRNGFSEASYIASMKKSLSHNIIESIFNAEYIAPRAMSQEIAKYLNSEITFDYVEVDPKKHLSFKDSNIPEEEFQKFYDENKERFIEPETRDIEYVEIPLDSIKINVSQDEIKDYYNKNISEYNSPALYSYYEITASIKEEADKILDMLDSGRNINEIRNAFGNNISIQFHENVEEQLVKDKKIKLSSRPFIDESEGRFHILKREIFFPEKKISLEKASKDITSVIKQKKTEVALRDFMNEVDDFVAGAANIDEISNHFKFKKVSKNKIYNDLNNILYAKSFELDEGEFSESFELKPNLNVIVLVKKVYPSKQLDYIDCRARIVEILQNDLARKTVSAKLNKLRESSNNDNFILNLKNLGFGVSKNNKITIAKINEGNFGHYPKNMLNELFSLEKGKITNTIFYDDKIYLAILRDRSYANNLKESAIRENVAKNYQSGVIDELILYLRKDSNMSIIK